MNRTQGQLQRWARATTVLVALLTSGAIACTDDEQSPSTASLTPALTASPTPGPGTETPASTLFRQAHDRWLAAAIRDYRFTLQRRCECPDEWSAPTAITVRDGAVVSATIEGGSAPEGAALTIDDLFNAIADALNEPVDTSVTYDEALGYPLDVQLDLEAIAVDGGLSLTVSDFERLD
jgi:hypothetical protein